MTPRKTLTEPRDYTVRGRARQTTLILASASPRRRELLAGAGYCLRIRPAHIPEHRLGRESPEAMAMRLARAKSLAVANDLRSGIVLGADTLVVLDGRALGKPANPAMARRMLRTLSGRRHSVITAVSLTDAASGCSASLIARSTVTFRAISDDEIRAYVQTAEPMDKAGAYAIQGGAAGFVLSFRGSHSNIVGLPVDRLAGLLEKLRGRMARRMARLELRKRVRGTLEK